MSNSNHQNQASTTSDVIYEFTILRKMIGALPTNIQILLAAQLEKTLSTLASRDTAFVQTILTDISDAELAIKCMEFDLEATRRERDALRDR